MKPSALLACVTICFPAGLVVLAGLPGRSNLDSQFYSKSNLPVNLDSSRQFNKQVLIASAESSSVYVKTRLDITLEQLSHQLDIPSDYLADLNDCDINRKFSNNEWVAIPAKSINTIRFVVALDDSEIRRTQPNRSIFAKIDDNLAKIASRYEVPLKELTRLNPGLNPITRLAVDTPIKLFQPLRARNTLAITPGSSGGLSWPGLPDFGNQPSQRSFTSYVWPAAGTLTSGYGWRWGRMHRGIDIANSVGTPIHSVADGVVVSSGWNDGGYGYLVEVSHNDGTLTRYAHNSRLLVSKGMNIAQGTPIALMGSTGRSTGPHLHFEIIPARSGAVNPVAYLPQR